MQRSGQRTLADHKNIKISLREMSLANNWFHINFYKLAHPTYNLAIEIVVHRNLPTKSRSSIEFKFVKDQVAVSLKKNRSHCWLQGSLGRLPGLAVFSYDLLFWCAFCSSWWSAVGWDLMVRCLLLVVGCCRVLTVDFWLLVLVVVFGSWSSSFDCRLLVVGIG